MPTIDWQRWQTAAFLDAQRRRQPVLLLLEVAWAPACLEAHQRIFARPDVVHAVREWTVPVRVDADWRPDIADRYGLGHWPSLLLLTPEGDVLTGGTRLDDGLAARLGAVGAAYRARGAAPPADAPEPRLDAPDDLDDWRAIAADELWQARDRRLGAFLEDDVPSAGATLAALARAAVTAASGWAEAADATIAALDDIVALATPGLAGRHGGPLRLEAVADWVRVLSRAVHLVPDAGWAAVLDPLAGLLRREFLREDLQWRPWAGARDLVLVDSAARACRALLAFAGTREQPDDARIAIESLEALVLPSYVRGSGVAHVLHHGTSRGPTLLDDAMHLAHALLDAEAWRGDGVYRDLADELRQTTRVRLQDGSGALQDRRAALAGGGQVGRLADPLHPLTGNALAALLERRLGDDAASLPDAVALLRAVGPTTRGAGVFAAPVVLAWEALAPAGDVVAAW